MPTRLTEKTNGKDAETITSDELEQLFPSSQEDSNFKYSGKCRYCQVEIDFSDTSQVRIIKNKEESQKLCLYHIGCYDRYIRRTID